MPTPMIGGHEGSGVVEEVGPGVSGLVPGDHVVLGFIPSCGRCAPCSTGHQNLCDLGALIGYGRQVDGTSRHHARGQDLNLMCLLGAFADHTVVNEASCVRIDPSHSAAHGLPGGMRRRSPGGGRPCTPPTPARAKPWWWWASAASVPRPSRGPSWPGAGAVVAIDPVEFKRDKATGFGADATFASMEEAYPPAEGDDQGPHGRQGDHGHGGRPR